MRSAEMLSRLLVWVTCLFLCNICIFPKDFSSTAYASERFLDDELQDLLNKYNDNDGSASSPFESLWKTFKDVIDSTSNVLSSSLLSPETGSFDEEDNSFVWSDQDTKDGMLDRRGLLMEKSLNEHYVQQFFNFFPQLKEYISIAEEENLILQTKASDQKSQTQTSPTSLGVHRWAQADPIDGSTKCYCFSGGSDSFWSFQWCPQKATIYQGRRMRGGNFVPEYNLGRRLSSLKGGTMEKTGDLQYLLEATKTKYPSAVAIHSYQGGSTCVESGSQKRASVIVLHGSNSKKCAAGKNGDIFIESVVEARVCQYVLNVCLDSWNERQLAKASSSKVNRSDYEGSSSPINDRTDLFTEASIGDINQTLHYIKNHIIEPFAGKYAKGRARESMLTSLHSALPPFPPTRIQANLKLIKEMFMHAYDSYMYNGYPASEVKPISCGPASFNLVKIPGLTLIDSLDTLVILGNYTEFARAVERLRFLNYNVYEETGIYTAGGGLFDINYNVSVFETNIRVLGGLLSAHQLATAFLEDKVLEREIWAEDNSILIGASGKFQEMKGHYWVYDDFLLDLARDIGDRLLPAFETDTGIPYGTVNLINGIPEGETQIASLAGGGTLSLEMELLSRLTGNEEYGRAAKLAARAFFMRRSTHDLFGKHICTRSGVWTESLSGIGSNSDSFYEYLIKHHILFPEDSDFWFQLVAAYGGVYNETRVGEWYGDVEMRRGRKQRGAPRTVFEALMAFYPGMQVLLGEITPAARTLNSFFLVREYSGFLPERFDFGNWKVDHGGGTHYLRPELLESAYFLHRSSKGLQTQFRQRLNNYTSDSSGWVWAGDFALHTLEKLTRTECGYATMKNISPKTSGKLNADRSRMRLMDEMPSFFLSETLKYLYLLFDDNNILHTDEDRDWVFTTEAHPIHNEGKEASADAELIKQAKELKSRIRKRLNKRKTIRNEIPDGLMQEKWTEESDLRTFANQLEPLVKNNADIYTHRKRVEAYYSQHDSSLSTAVERLFPNDNGFSPFDVYNERIHSLNPTYLTFRKLGNGKDLTSSCPNFYSSNFLWLRALNGGISDYSDSFKSRTDDEFLVSESDIIQLGSVDALALHGAGVHIQSLYDAFFQIRNPQENQKGSDVASSSSSHNREPEQDGSGVTRFDMGDDIGSFDISAFPGGSGFFVQHVQSGETMVATMIAAEESSLDSEGPLILVYSTTSDTSVEATSISGDDSHRSVVLADVDGNSYSCQVQIMESKIHVDEDMTCHTQAGTSRDCSSSETRDKIVHQFPCSPALFGPTHTSHLRKVDLIEVEAKIRQSSANDKHGCGRFSMSGGNQWSRAKNKSPVVSFVDRGDCTFQEKAFNQKFTQGSEAVIVVNSNQGDDLFVMSGGGSEEIYKLDHADYPVTVLVTWADGQKVLKTLEENANKINVGVSARISLIKDWVPPESEVEGNNSKFWPRVTANPEALQIYSKSGWGIHAVQSFTDSETEVQWQLYLMRHNMGKEAASKQ